MKQAISTWLVLLTLSLLAPLGRTQQNSQVPDDTRALKTAEQAVARVYEYTGFEELKDIKGEKAEEIAELTVVETDDTPCLYKEVEGRQVWKVQLDNVKLIMPDWDPQLIRRGSYKSYTALVDAETGVLFRVYSKLDYNDPDLEPEPSGEEATAEFVSMRLIFTEFLSEPPEVNLSAALSSAIASNPLAAKELIAFCAVLKACDQPAIPVWSILGRGIPPHDLGANDHLRPIYMRNRWRTTVSAETGEPMSASNTPSIGIREEDRERFEKLWHENAVRTNEEYVIPVEVDTE